MSHTNLESTAAANNNKEPKSRAPRKEQPRPKLSVPSPTAATKPPEKVEQQAWRQKQTSILKMPLTEKNGAPLPLSPKTKWVANVKELKQQQGSDGAKTMSRTSAAPNLSWNEIEAKMGKRMRDLASPVVATSGTAPVPFGANQPSTTPKPKLHIPTDDKKRKSAPVVVNPPIVETSARKTSKYAKARQDVTAPKTNNPDISRKLVTAPIARDVPSDEVENIPSPTELTPMTPSFQTAVSSAATPRKRSQKINDPVQENIAPEISSSEKMLRERSDDPAHKYEIQGIVAKAAPPKVYPTPPVMTFLKNSDAVHPNHTLSVVTVGTPSRAAQKTSRSLTPKSKGKLSWLRMALTPKDGNTPKQRPTISKAHSNTTSRSYETHSKDTTTLESTPYKPVAGKFTTPLQQLLWLSAVQKCIKESCPPPPAPAAPALDPSRDVDLAPPVLTDQPITQKVSILTRLDNLAEAATGSSDIVDRTPDHPQYYNHTQDTGVYVDYSTFDDGDGESVSSMELLFQWLTCRELSDGTKKQSASVAPPGTVVATTNTVFSEELSIDMEAKPRRRTLFSR